MDNVEAQKHDEFKNYNDLQKSLRLLDDRGLVLCMASFAEERLGELLSVFLIEGKSAEKILSGFNAPLGNFSTRIEACHALGLITTDQYSDLLNLRKIRNIFAHSWKEVTLDQDHIGDRITNLSFPTSGGKFPESNREKLIHSISFLLLEITIQSSQIKKNKLELKPIARRIFAGFSGDPEKQIDELIEITSKIKTELPNASGERKRFLEAELLRCAFALNTIPKISEI